MKQYTSEDAMAEKRREFLRNKRSGINQGGAS
jgi:hypothetical protein